MKTNYLKLSVGIDIAKDTFYACICVVTTDLEKKVLATKEFKNNPSGFKTLIQWLGKEKGLKNMDGIFVMEATGVYHEALAFFLYGAGKRVSVMQSGRVKRYAQSLPQRSKTDLLDCKMLSYLGCERSLYSWKPPSGEYLDLKMLCRERSDIVLCITNTTNKLHSKEAAYSVPKNTIKRYGKRLKLYKQQLDVVEQEMKELVNSNAELKEKIKKLISIPGVGFITAAVVTGETLGFHEITNIKQLTSYAGYDVKQRESGAYKGKTTISKKGNKHLRAIMHFPSMTAVRMDTPLRVFYLRLKGRKSKPIIALVAVQRKMLGLMYSLWKKDEYYRDPRKTQDKKAKEEIDVKGQKTVAPRSKGGATQDRLPSINQRKPSFYKVKDKINAKKLVF